MKEKKPMSVHSMKHKPLAPLEEKLEDNPRNFITVPPVYLKKCSDRMKNNELAEALGYSGAGLSAILNDENACRKVIELAAEQIWNERFVEKPNDKAVCAFISGDVPLLKMVQAMIDIGCGKFVFIEMPK